MATATNQAFVIPNAVNPVQSITGKFAGGSVVLGHGHDSYQIVRNANGTLTVRAAWPHRSTRMSMPSARIIPARAASSRPTLKRQ